MTVTYFDNVFNCCSGNYLTKPIPATARYKALRLQPLASWGRGFESHRGNGCMSLVIVACCEGTGLCAGPITRPEEPYRACCV